MSDRSKKLLFAAMFVLVSAGMGYAAYYLLFRAPQITPTTNQAAGPGYGGALPQAGTGAPKPVTPTQPGQLPPSAGAPTVTGAAQPAAPSGTTVLNQGITQAMSASPDGKSARFYNPTDGRFYKVGPDGALQTLGDKQFFNVDTVSWGNTTDQAILSFPDGTKVYYDFASKQQVNLPSHWSDFTFSPNDTQVAAKSIGVDPANRYLVLSNPNGTEAKAIESLGDNADKVHIDWSPSSQVVGYSFTGDPQSGSEQQVLLIGQNHENFKSIISPGQDFLPNWSPTGNQLLFSALDSANGNEPTLWLTSGDTATIGAGRKSLNLNTWADKCVWGSDSLLFCAVPQNLPPNAGLMRSEFNTLPDDLYRIDLTNNSMTKINTPDQNHPVRNPILSKDLKKFIFTDAETGTLYSYDIK